MKAIYKKMPTKVEVGRQIVKLCKSVGVEWPTKIVFHRSPLSTCEDDHLILMDPDWAVDSDGPDGMWPTPLHERYWANVIHEVAHWVTFKSGIAEEVDHRPLMYQVLLGLILREGIPLDVVWKVESRYKPGALSRGSKLAAEAIIQNALGRSPVNGEQHGAVIVPFPALEHTA